VDTSTLSRTWQRRVGAARRHSHRAATVAVTLCALLGGAAALKVFLVTPHPSEADVTAITNRIDNQRAAAGQFGADCVAMFVTTAATKVAALQPCLTLPKSQTVPQANRAAATPPWVINTPKVWSVIPQGSAGDADLYAVTVVVQQRPYVSAEPIRAFYRLPVSIWHYQPRALDWPVPTSDPGAGADVTMSYDHPLSPSGRVYAVVAGFITTYLTATTGLDRYVVADSWIKPIGGYQSAVIENADATSEVAGAAAPDAQIRVRATVTAQTSQFATINFSFPLTVENSGGTWMVADIDLIPQLNDRADSVPAGTHN
jgi:Conjugative transposon protein TcpC